MRGSVLGLWRAFGLEGRCLVLWVGAWHSFSSGTWVNGSRIASSNGAYASSRATALRDPVNVTSSRLMHALRVTE